MLGVCLNTWQCGKWGDNNGCWLRGKSYRIWKCPRGTNIDHNSLWFKWHPTTDTPPVHSGVLRCWCLPLHQDVQSCCPWSLASLLKCAIRALGAYNIFKAVCCFSCMISYYPILWLWQKKVNVICSQRWRLAHFNRLALCKHVKIMRICKIQYFKFKGKWLVIAI